MTETAPRREALVVRVLVELADTLVDDYDVIDLLDQLVAHSVDLLAADSGVMEHRVRRFWSSRSGSFGAVLRGVGRSVSDGSVAGSPPSGWVVDESARTGLV
jgi:hypothetical protein